jgi:hypothetical protein
MTGSMVKILERLKRGPASVSSLAHAARCSASSIKTFVSRIRRETGMKITRDHGEPTYRLER